MRWRPWGKLSVPCPNTPLLSAWLVAVVACGHTTLWCCVRPARPSRSRPRLAAVAPSSAQAPSIWSSIDGVPSPSQPRLLKKPKVHGVTRWGRSGRVRPRDRADNITKVKLGRTLASESRPELSGDRNQLSASGLKLEDLSKRHPVSM